MNLRAASSTKPKKTFDMGETTRGESCVVVG